MYFHELTGDVVRRRLGVDDQYVVDGVLAFGVFDRYAGSIVRDVARHGEQQGLDVAMQPIEVTEYSHAVEVVAGRGGVIRRLWLVPVMGTAMMAYYVHLACLLEARAIVLGGSVGGLAAGMATGDIVVPTSMVGNDNALLYARHSAPSTVPARGSGLPRDSARQVPDAGLGSALAERLAVLQPEVTIWRGETTTCEMLGAETARDVAEWAAAGFVAVEMEAAVVCAVGRAFGVPAAAAFYVADCLVDGHHLYHAAYGESRTVRRDARRLVAAAAVDVLLDTLSDEAGVVPTSETAQDSAQDQDSQV